MPLSARPLVFALKQASPKSGVIAFGAIGATLMAFAAAATPVAAQDNGVKSIRFGKTGNWTVMAVFDRKGAFNHCSARATYRSGIQISLIAYASQNWSVQFYKSDWPKRPVSTFPATLLVDGKVVMRTNGRFRGRSAFINMGSSASRVRAIMRGRVMTVRSETGTSKYRLDGTFRAAQKVADCWDKSRQVNTARNDGAFGTPPPRNNNGAFGAPPRNNNTRRPQQRNSRRSTLSRANTMEFAVRYLAKARSRYEILASDKNVFKDYPVNWRYDNGRIGGMMVVNSSNPNAEAGLQTQLSALARGCKGRSATDRRPTTGEAGRRVARARGMCEVDGQMFAYDYTAAELSSRRLMLIIEGRVEKAAAPRRAPSAALPLPPAVTPPPAAAAPRNPPPLAAPTPARELDANEL